MDDLPPVPPLESGLDRRLLKSTLWVWFLTMMVIRILHDLQRIPFFAKYDAIFTAVILIYVPVVVFYRRGERVDFFERSVKQFLTSLGWVAVLSAVIFPLLEIGNHYFQALIMGKHYVGGNYQGLAKIFLFNLVAIAIPEEIFYRGYLQYQLNRVWGRPWRFLGTPIGKSLLITSVLFALSHSLIQLEWWHFAIFFPALVFGWLREKTGAVTAGALFHALSNVYSYWILLNYR